MLNIKTVAGSVVAALAMWAATTPAGAASLGPNGFAVASGETDPVGGSVLFSTNVTFTGVNFSGILTSSVISGDTSSPFSGLTFTYQFDITNAITPANTLSVSDFTGYQTDVSYQTPGSGVAPTFVSRGPSGDVIHFSFPGAAGVGTGQNTDLLVVQTDASSWILNFGSIQAGSPNMTLVAPAPVPEPTTAGLMALGVGVLACSRRLKNCYTASRKTVS